MKRDDHQRGRKHQRRFAKRHGYYWLPCVICGEYHGGHEGGGLLLDPDHGGGTIICPFCTSERQGQAERALRDAGITSTVACGRWWPGSGTVEHHIGAGASGRRLR